MFINEHKIEIVLCSESARKESKKRVHEEVIAEDYDSTKDEISQIDISQKFMVILAQIIMIILLYNRVSKSDMYVRLIYNKFLNYNFRATAVVLINIIFITIVQKNARKCGDLAMYNLLISI